MSVIILETLHQNRYFKANSEFDNFPFKAENCNNMLGVDFCPGQFSCTKCSYLRLPFSQRAPERFIIHL